MSASWEGSCGCLSFEAQHRANPEWHARAAIEFSALFASPIYFLSMPHLHDPHCELLVLNGIDDSIVALPDPVSFLPRQFLMPLWSRVLAERLYATEDVLQIFFWYGTEVLFNRFFEIDLIFGHLSSVS